MGKCAQNVLGVEGQNWTEWTETADELFFKMSTRGLALSECAWSRSRDYSDFLDRLQANKKLLDKMGICYGEDWITLQKSKKRRKKAAKKIGFNVKDYDYEYEISAKK